MAMSASANVRFAVIGMAKCKLGMQTSMHTNFSKREKKLQVNNY